MRCSIKIPMEVKSNKIIRKTPINLRILNWSMFALIVLACSGKVWTDLTSKQTANTETYTIRNIASVIYMIPYTIISIVLFVALAKIRAFFKEKGLGQRVDTGKIVLHCVIFALFTLELIGEFLIALSDNKTFIYISEAVLISSIVLSDYAILWILWQLGTTVKDTNKSCR